MRPIAYCDRHGGRVPYDDIVREYGLMMCAECYEISTIADYLSRAYSAHYRLSKETESAVVAELRAKLVSSAGLKAAAEAEMSRLKEVEAGLAGNELRQRCAISGVYLGFLRAVLA